MRFLARIIETVTEIFSGHVQAWLTLALTRLTPYYFLMCE